MSYIIMLSLYSSAFGSYAPNLYSIVDPKTDFHIYASLIIIIATVINYFSVKVVSDIESFAVIIKINNTRFIYYDRRIWTITK
ncbi:MAG: hypothetical protein R2771_04305 [Saprospiraceae bacterium]